MDNPGLLAHLPALHALLLVVFLHIFTTDTKNYVTELWYHSFCDADDVCVAGNDECPAKVKPRTVMTPTSSATVTAPSPVDSFKIDTVNPCRASAGICDTAEYCEVLRR